MSTKIENGIKKQVILPALSWNYLNKQAQLMSGMEGRKVTENEIIRRLVKGQIEYETKTNVIKPL